MHQFFSALLITIILAFVTTQNSYGQFSYKAKKANLTINFGKENGWKLTNQAGTKTYFEFSDENVYVQIVGETLRIYKMSSGLWNTHPESKFMDDIGIKNSFITILANVNAFDSFSSFWISSSGGHIRISRYPESVTYKAGSFPSQELNNHFIGNSIFLNQNKAAKISSKTNIFMVAPSRDVFEIDPIMKIWRLILPNRTLTPWSSDAPKEKLLFNIFNKADFKKIIPLGTKSNKFYFQIIDHKNKMGLAYLTKDYFQVVIEVPPLFDFISPSIDSDYHLIKNKEKLGVLYFPISQNEEEIKEFKSFYTPAKSKLKAQVFTQKNGLLLSDGQPFNVTKNDINKTSNDFLSAINFGIEVINYDLILYTEYDESQNINHSGLFRISQNQWYIKPEKNLLLNYPTTILEVNQTPSNQLLYSCYSLNGQLKTQNVSYNYPKRFTALVALILESEIDTIIPIPEFDPYTYKYKSLEKWGIITIKGEQFKSITSAKYDWVQHYGNQKSLLIINDGKFGWYGVDYESSDSILFLIEPRTANLALSQSNSLVIDTNIPSTNNTVHQVEYSNNHYIFNTITNGGAQAHFSAWIQTSFNSKHINTSSKIESSQGYFNLINIQNDIASMSLINHKLKPVLQTTYDSVSIFSNQMLLFDKSKSTIFTLASGKQIRRVQLIAAFYIGKPIKSLNKYKQVYYFENHYLAQKDNSWLVLKKDGKPTHKLPFKSITEAFTFTNTIIK